MGISPNPTVTVSTLSRHDNDRRRCFSFNFSYCCCCCLRCSRPGCRTCHWKRCWRLPCWRYGLLLLCGATLLSALIPGAPLARWLLSKDAERHRLLAENEQRLQRSRQILERYRSGVSQDGQRVTRDSSPAGAVVDVGVTVLTMARGRRMKGEVSYRTEYLTQSVATVLQVMNDSSLRRSYAFHICNIDDDPDRFSEAKSLEDVIPVFKRYGAANATSAKVTTTIWEKLKTDYVYCMRQTLAQGARYVLLMEDDAVAHPDLFHVLEHVLAKVIEAPGARPVAYVKLYHPQRLLGYISLEVERLTELVALSLTLGAVLTWWRSAQRGGGGGGGGWHPHPNPHHDLGLGALPYREVMCRWAGWTVAVAVLALAVGRTNLLELRRLSPHLYQVTPTPSCCIPAVLYTRQGAADFAGFLSNVTCTARHSTDIRMDEFREAKTRARGLLVQPNLFSHIGLVSSLRSKEVNPLMVQ